MALAMEALRSIGARSNGAIDDAPRSLLLPVLLRRQPLLAGVNLSVAVLVAVVMAPSVGFGTLVGWLGYMTATQLARLIVYRRYHDCGLTQAQERAMGLWLTLSSAASGLGWAIGGTAFSLAGETLHEGFLWLVLSSLAGMAIAALPVHPPAFLAFVLPVLLPFAVKLGLSNQPTEQIMGLIAGVYLVGIILVGQQLHRSLRQSAMLDLANAQQLAGLVNAHGNLERTIAMRTRELETMNAALAGEVAERRQAEARARHLLEHDLLTNLPNRRLLRDRLGQVLARAQRFGSQVAVARLDVERLREVNETFGHAAGDEILRELAARLRLIVRRTDTLARVGPDDFVLVAPDIEAPRGVATVAEKVLAAARTPFLAGGAELRLKVSLGVAHAPEHGIDVDTLLGGADLALLDVKAKGGGHWQALTSHLRAAAHGRMQLEAELCRAIEENQLRLVYQPRFAIEDGAMVGAEALVRWQHPSLGLMSPDRFVPLAEATGLIRDLGRWVTAAACRQGRAWHDAGRPLPIAVNLSALELGQAGLVDQLEATLAQADLPPTLLALEITESACLDRDPAALEDDLGRLRRLGVQIAIDDFGTGYASLAYLKRLPFDVLKIDRSFVHNMETDTRDQAIVAAIVTLARQLDKMVVAEGVETPSQLARLRDLGCHEAQGFLLGAPMPAERLEPLRVPA